MVCFLVWFRHPCTYYWKYIIWFCQCLKLIHGNTIFRYSSVTSLFWFSMVCEFHPRQCTAVVCRSFILEKHSTLRRCHCVFTYSFYCWWKPCCLQFGVIISTAIWIFLYVSLPWGSSRSMWLIDSTCSRTSRAKVGSHQATPPPSLPELSSANDWVQCRC